MDAQKSQNKSFNWKKGSCADGQSKQAFADDKTVFSYRSAATSAAPKSVTTAFDTKSYCSSKVDIELEYLAREVDLERDRRRKLQQRAVTLAKLLEDKAALEEVEDKRMRKTLKAQDKKYAPKFEHH